MNARLRTCLLVALGFLGWAAWSPDEASAQRVTVYRPSVTAYVPGVYGGYAVQPQYYGGYSYPQQYYGAYGTGYVPSYGSAYYGGYSYPSYNYGYPAYSYPSYGYRGSYRSAYRGGYYRY